MGRQYPHDLYEEIPILEAARRCGRVLNDRTLEGDEVEASCPFCGDRGPGKYHLSLNTRKNQYRCNLCEASGNSVSLYARMNGTSYRQAHEVLSKDVYKRQESVSVVVWYPRLRADLSLYKTPYPDFPIPRLVFGFSVGAADGAVRCV